MSLRVTLDFADLASDELRAIANELQRPAGVNAAMAAGTEQWIKETGAVIASHEHDSADRLGANPTGHLGKAYEQIESQSSAAGAVLLVPRASRLRAAFGPYVLTPGPGKTYLTIPVARDAYGRRAGEFDDLFFARVGPKKQPVLVRRHEFADATPQSRSAKGKRYDRNKPLEVMYALVTEANIPEDPALIPFDKLTDAAALSAEKYIDAILESRKGGLA